MRSGDALFIISHTHTHTHTQGRPWQCWSPRHTHTPLRMAVLCCFQTSTELQTFSWNYPEGLSWEKANVFVNFSAHPPKNVSWQFLVKHPERWVSLSMMFLMREQKKIQISQDEKEVPYIWKTKMSTGRDANRELLPLRANAAVVFAVNKKTLLFAAEFKPCVLHLLSDQTSSLA